MKKIAVLCLTLIMTILSAQTVNTPIFSMNENHQYSISLNEYLVFTDSSSHQRSMVRYHYYISIGDSMNMFIFLKPRDSATVERLLDFLSLSSATSASTSFGLGSIYEQLQKNSEQELNVGNKLFLKYYSEWGSFISSNILVYWAEIDHSYFSECLIQFIDPIPRELMMQKNYQDSEAFFKILHQFDELVSTVRFVNVVMKTTVDLRLRKEPSLSSETLTIIPENTEVLLQEYGPTATIDGISGSWVKVETEKKQIGWCFNGYLE